MQYKTITHELLQQQPQLYDQLLNQRTLLSTLESYASDLKASHEAWKDQLAQAKPGSDASQVASEALEIAVKELEEHLLNWSPGGKEAFPVDEAMAFLRLHTPSA